MVVVQVSKSFKEVEEEECCGSGGDMMIKRRTSSRIKIIAEQQDNKRRLLLKSIQQEDDYFGDTKKPIKRRRTKSCNTTATTSTNKNSKNKKITKKTNTTTTTTTRGLSAPPTEQRDDDHIDDAETEVEAEAGFSPLEQQQEEEEGVVVGGSSGVGGFRGDSGGDDVAPVDFSLLGDTAKVIQTIRIFNKHYLHFIQEEDKRVNIRDAERKVAESSKGNKKGGGQEVEIKRGSKRPDLKASAKMRDMGSILYPEKRIGAIPGVNVGYQFYSRAEMVVVGFHSHWLSGIDYIGKGAKGYDGYSLPLAVAIVLSGGYEDDLDNSEDVIYTGSGGNDLLGNKRQIAHQVMDRGNLALKNCIEQKTSVRVIRGHQSKTSYVGKIYTYDGLYKVDDNWAEVGVSGFTVYKYRLKRVNGQPQLTTNQVHFSNGRVPNSVSEVRGLVCKDISGGLEAIPIPATNTVDDPAVLPTDYTYHKTMIVSKSVKLPKAPPGCGCRGSCIDPQRCACAKLNGSEFPYVQRNGGRLIEPKSVVFECGPHCGCGPECVNRTSQKGIKYRLEVFRTPKKGWGVRSWDFIPSGAPICEYIGKLMRTEETDSAHDNFYIISCDTLETMAGLDGRQSRLKDVSLPSHMLRNVKDRIDCDPEYCVDASTKGNVARYINHSCQPNLFIQSVLSDHHELSQARIVLFAADNIPPLTELTYDYAYIIDSVMGPDGNPKNVDCYCGADDCRKRLL